MLLVLPQKRSLCHEEVRPSKHPSALIVIVNFVEIQLLAPLGVEDERKATLSL